jgi:CRISPR-associated endonuclease/helicase Cas3
MRGLGKLWNGVGEHAGLVGVHPIMGGADPDGDWHLFPEERAILIGTQDMLLSRALNRGYASGRARWPVDFGLLSHDALWVMDEVQSWTLVLPRADSFRLITITTPERAFAPVTRGG